MASIKYTINGKADNSAIDKTKQGLLGLGDAVNNVNNIFKSFIVLKTFQFVKNFSTEAVTEFAKVEQSTIRLKAALGAFTFDRFQEFAETLSKISTEDADGILEVASNLAALGRSEDDIKKIITAANNLANATGTNLKEAWKQVNATFDGTPGKLGKLVIGLNGLSESQLKAGKGAELINAQMGKISEAMGESTAIKIKNLTAAFGDLKEGLGAVLAPSTNMFAAFVTDIVKGWTSAINEFTRYNEIVKKGNNATAKDLFEKKGIELLRLQREAASDIAKNFGTFEDWKNKNARNNNSFSLSRQPKIEDEETQRSRYNQDLAKFLNSPYQQGLANSINELNGDIVGLTEAIKGEKAKEEKDNKAKANTLIPIIPIDKAAITSFDELKTSIAGLNYTISNEMMVGFKEATIALENAVKANNGYSGGENTFAAESYEAPSMLDGIFAGISGFANALGPVIGSLGSVSAIMDPLGVILSGIMDVLAPIIDTLLAPLIGILRIVGRVIGAMLAPALKMLTPIIEIISKAFIWLYNNAIMPLANAIIWVMTTIYNGVAQVVNGLLSMIDNINILGWSPDVSYRVSELDYNSMALQSINESDLTSAGNSTAASASAASASYSGARDIIININYDRSYINGDAREIALNLRSELRQIEALGL